MEDTRHTKGPWRLSRTRRYVMDGWGAPWVCEVTERPEFEANARLIAAAPDLLRALKYCVIERSEWLDEARAAIAKAEARTSTAQLHEHQPTPTANKTRA